jgi:hypothetical protein
MRFIMFYEVLMEKRAESKAEKKFKARIALVRASQGGDESVSNAVADEYANVLGRLAEGRHTPREEG